jgi:hypothetical protein
MLLHIGVGHAFGFASRKGKGRPDLQKWHGLCGLPLPLSLPRLLATSAVSQSVDTALTLLLVASITRLLPMLATTVSTATATCRTAVDATTATATVTAAGAVQHMCVLIMTRLPPSTVPRRVTLWRRT